MVYESLNSLLDTFIKAAKDDEYWAGNLYICSDDNTVFLIKRSGVVNNPNLWNIPGGRSSEKDSDIEETAQRESKEELGTLPEDAEFIKKYTLSENKDRFIYIYKLSKDAKEKWIPKIKLNKESSTAAWFKLDKLPPKTNFDLTWIPKELQKSASLIKIASVITQPRSEHKFYIPSSLEKEIKDYIEPYVKADDHGQFYHLKNIYLDTDKYDFYNNHLLLPDRFKLRARFYDNDDKAFLEIKRKADGHITKQRSIVPNEMYTEALNMPESIQFSKVAQSTNAHPVVIIDYDREALNDVNNEKSGGRVTFDKNIKFSQTDSYDRDQNGARDILSPDVSIMEFKFNGKMPKFMKKALEKFNLQKTPVSKYFKSISNLLV